MKITLNRINNDFLFKCTNSQGNSIILDNTSQENAQGVSPMESILMAVASCSGIDIISILKKQKQEITNFSAEVEGERIQVDQAKPFKSINIIFSIDGEVDPSKAIKAAGMSFEKYCSVTKSLASNIKVIYSVKVNGEIVK